MGFYYNFWKACPHFHLNYSKVYRVTYSWLKYYNTELRGNNNKDKETKEKILIELLEEIRTSITKSMKKLEYEKI